MWDIQNLGFDSSTYWETATTSLNLSSSSYSSYNCFSASVSSARLCASCYTLIGSVTSSYDSGSYISNWGFGQCCKKPAYIERISSFWNIISCDGFFFTWYPAKLLLVSIMSAATMVFNTYWNSGSKIL